MSSWVRRLAMFWPAVLLAAVLAASETGAVPAPSGSGGPATTHMARVAPELASGPGGGPLDLVVSLDQVAGGALERSLRALDPTAWIGSQVPVARILVPSDELGRLRRIPGVRAIYPNRELPPVQPPGPSPPSMLAAPRQAESSGSSVTGKGVTIAVVDTGVDGTHPDLKSAMVANVWFPADPLSPIEGLDNTDMTHGHGTLVAGTAAGRGVASNGRYRGAAPGASLVGVGLGELGHGITIYGIMGAYEWILEHREQYKIRVVNNSYGTETFEVFDPDDPVNRATRTAADAGIAVLFGVGNDGGELTMSGFAAAPWVIAVGATSRVGKVSDFSAGGIEADVMGSDFSDRLIAGETRSPLNMGLYHPSVVAPGEDIIGPRATTAAPDYPNDPTDPGDRTNYRTGSGTSFSGPLVAGVIGRVLEANPKLNPENVRRVLQVTARPIPGAPFHRQGYGQVDPAAAVTLATSLVGRSTDEISQNLESRQRARDADILSALAHPISTSTEHRPWPPDRPLVERIPVEPGTRRIKVITTRGILMEEPGPTLTIRILDAAGREIARKMRQVETRTPATGLEVDLTTIDKPNWGQWTVEITDGEPNPTLPPPVEITVIATFAAPSR